MCIPDAKPLNSCHPMPSTAFQLHVATCRSHFVCIDPLVVRSLHSTLVSAACAQSQSACSSLSKPVGLLAVSPAHHVSPPAPIHLPLFSRLACLYLAVAVSRRPPTKRTSSCQPLRPPRHPPASGCRHCRTVATDSHLPHYLRAMPTRRLTTALPRLHPLLPLPMTQRRLSLQCHRRRVHVGCG